MKKKRVAALVMAAILGVTGFSVPGIGVVQAEEAHHRILRIILAAFSESVKIRHMMTGQQTNIRKRRRKQRELSIRYIK